MNQYFSEWLHILGKQELISPINACIGNKYARNSLMNVYYIKCMYIKEPTWAMTWYGNKKSVENFVSWHGVYVTIFQRLLVYVLVLKIKVKTRKVLCLRSKTFMFTDLNDSFIKYTNTALYTAEQSITLDYSLWLATLLALGSNENRHCNQKKLQYSFQAKIVISFMENKS